MCILSTPQSCSFHLLRVNTGASANKLDKKKRSPLLHSSYLPNLAITQELISFGAELNYQCPSTKYTPLLAAADGQQAETILYLLEKCTVVLLSSIRELLHLLIPIVEIEVNNCQKEGKSPLSLVANWEQERSEVILALIRKGTNVNAADLQGSLSLLNFTFISPLICFFYSIPLLMCTVGETALHTASRRGHVNIVHALLKAGADPNATLIV